MLLALVATFVLAACGGTPAAAPTSAPAADSPTAAPAAPATALAVGIVLPTKDETRWTQDEARFKEALDKAGYQVEILFSEKDSAKEKANVETLLTKGIKVLIICPVDGTAAAASAAAARAAGVKVISYDRLIRETDAVDYYVTFDSLAVGAQQAQAATTAPARTPAPPAPADRPTAGATSSRPAAISARPAGRRRDAA
nr:substrate-binding domain-containing protein [Oscillochloris sp. ZM17-4]